MAAALNWIFWGKIYNPNNHEWLFWPVIILCLNSGLNHGLKRPKMMQKSVKMPIFLPVDPEGPKDRDLDPSAKIGWSNFDPRSYHSNEESQTV